jgi:AraC family transcriptional regulator
MTNFDYVQKTIDLFEDSLGSDSPLTTVENLAGRIGYSTHHLGRLFQSLCGESLGRYMQKRRLAEAAERILSGGSSAALAAAGLGWEDYSSFSRAFKKEFGTSPGNLKTGRPDNLPLTVRARPRLSGATNGGLPEPVLIQAPEIHVSGLVFFMGPNEKTFHHPWSIWCRLAGKINGRRGQGTYQFSSWTDDPEASDQGIWIHCAVETDSNAPQEPVFFSRIIPAARLLKFSHTGPVEQLYETYRRIWEDYLPRSTFRLCGNREYQYYPEPNDRGIIEICLPVLD